MKIKDGVIMQGLQLEMRFILIEADKIWKELGEELVITSALDGTHSAGSLHYYGYALDFRTRYFDDVRVQSAYDKLVEFKKSEKAIYYSESDYPILSNRFDIVKHKTHMHVEYELPRCL